MDGIFYSALLRLVKVLSPSDKRRSGKRDIATFSPAASVRPKYSPRDSVGKESKVVLLLTTARRF